MGMNPKMKELYDLWENLRTKYGGIEKHGIYGEGGVGRIMNARRAASALRRQRMAKGMRRRWGRSIGSRSGAVRNLVANRVYAPSFAGESDALGSMMEANMRSKTFGIEGYRQVVEQMLRNKMGEDQMGSDGSGILDWVNAGANAAKAVKSL